MPPADPSRAPSSNRAMGSFGVLASHEALRIELKPTLLCKFQRITVHADSQSDWMRSILSATIRIDLKVCLALLHRADRTRSLERR